MLKKVRIENNGDTEFLPGTLVDVLDFEEMNEKLTAEGKEPAEGKQYHPWYYQGSTGYRILPVRSILPGDH